MTLNFLYCIAVLLELLQGLCTLEDFYSLGSIYRSPYDTLKGKGFYP